MLDFKSASVRIANSERAIDEMIEIAYGEAPPADLRAVIVNGAMGHKLERLAAALHRYSPEAQVFGTSCGGIVGREGAGEAMTHVAMMGVSGSAEQVYGASVDGIDQENSYEKAMELARSLKEKLPGVHTVYLICPGLGTACDRVLDAFYEQFGDDIQIFGGTSADNYKAIATFQYIEDHTTEHGAWAIGFADPTLKAAVKATHGFNAYGDPMRVTRAEGNRIYEIDGMPAWQAYATRMSLIPENDARVLMITAGGLAKKLDPVVADEYGNTHILRGAMQGKEPGVMYLSTTVQEGEEFWLTTRDEELIFSEQEKALKSLKEVIGDGEVVAVFQADCLARGRTLFGRVMKDELIGMMHSALLKDGEVPPWLGMYGFGEFCKLGGKNQFHTYTTSLMALYR